MPAPPEEEARTARAVVASVSMLSSTRSPPVCAAAARRQAAPPRAQALWECALMAAFALALLYLVSGGLNPFIYFRF